MVWEGKSDLQQCDNAEAQLPDAGNRCPGCGLCFWPGYSCPLQGKQIVVHVSMTLAELRSLHGSTPLDACALPFVSETAGNMAAAPATVSEAPVVPRSLVAPSRAATGNQESESPQDGRVAYGVKTHANAGTLAKQKDVGKDSDRDGEAQKHMDAAKNAGGLGLEVQTLGLEARGNADRELQHKSIQQPTAAGEVKGGAAAVKERPSGAAQKPEKFQAPLSANIAGKPATANVGPERGQQSARPPGEREMLELQQRIDDLQEALHHDDEEAMELRQTLVGSKNAEKVEKELRKNQENMRKWQ